MLKNLPKILSPNLLKALSEMGHGDEVVIADANYPATKMNNNVIRADGIKATDMLDAVLKVIPLDIYVNENFLIMKTANNDPYPTIWDEFDKIGQKNDPNVRKGYLERFDYYERSKKAFLIIQTGEERLYGNVILKKGVIK